MTTIKMVALPFTFLAALMLGGCVGAASDEGTERSDAPPNVALIDKDEGVAGQAQQAVGRAQQVAKLHMKAEDGTEADFLLPDGGAVKVTNDQLGIAYRLTGQVIDAEQVIVTVEQFNDIELKSLNSTDVLYLDQGRESREQSAITPFSLRMIGMENDHIRESLKQEVTATGSASLLTCCVTCGGWTTCCTPTPGHCCQITSSCGFGCGVCN